LAHEANIASHLLYKLIFGDNSMKPAIFLVILKLQNQHLHQHASQLNLPNYHQAAASLYEQRVQLPQAAQEALYHQPLEIILDLPAPQLEQWVMIQGYKYFNH